MNQVEVKRRQIEICSGIICLINILIFGNILGNNGVAYLVIALACSSFIQTVISGGLSDALGRMLRVRKTKGQYKNAMYIRKRVLILQASIGLVGSIILAACAGVLAQNLFQVQYSTFLMVLLAPALFVRTISTVLIGYFQGEGAELPAAVAAPLRQLVLMGLGVLFVRILGNYGAKVSDLLGDTAYTAMYGGVGVVIAINLSELLVLLFLLFILMGSRRSLQKQDSEGLKQMDSLSNTVKILYGSMLFPILLQLLEQLPIWMGALFYRKSVMDTGVFSENYGLLSGKYFVVCGILILFICAMILSVIAKTAGAFRKEDYRSAKSIFQSGLHTAVVFALFCSVFVAVMAEQLTKVICKSNVETAAEMLRYGSILILFAVLFFYFSRLLLFTGKKYHLLGCMGVMDILFVIMASVLLNMGKVGIFSLVYALVAAVGIGCIVVGLLCFRLLRTGIEWLKIFAIPAGAACVSGLICMFLGKMLTAHLGNLVTLIVGLIIGAVVYRSLLLLFKKYSND